jgi:hypothetical protein
MNSLIRFLIPLFFLLFTVTISQTAPDAEVVDTSVAYHSRNISTEQIERLPVGRNLAGLITLAPSQVYSTDVPGTERITGTSQFIDNSELQVLIRTDQNSQSNLKVCDLFDLDAICVQKISAPASLAPGLQYGGRANSGVVSIITRSGSTEFSQGRAFNPNKSNFKKGKFSFYYAPEKDFPVGAISSTGISGDGSASFQIINFPGDSYFFFRNNNSKFRPTGLFTKIPLGNVGFVSSGTLSNRIDNLSGGPDLRFFGYRQYFNVGFPDMKSQVKLQVLNADTFDRIGGPVNYTPALRSRYPIEEQSQSVEIEPGGAFLAFTKYHAASDRNLGYVRGISPTGAPQKQKLFTPIARMRTTEFGINALDIIRVTPDVSPE